jgi:dihydrofolate reductase
VSKVRVNAFTVSADGFGAGPDQGREQPMGRGGGQLHQWLLPTRIFQRNVLARDGGTTGIDNDFAARSFENLGAWIMGRNMFGPVRGPWPDDEWSASICRPDCSTKCTSPSRRCWSVKASPGSKASTFLRSGTE